MGYRKKIPTAHSLSPLARTLDIDRVRLTVVLFAWMKAICLASARKHVESNLQLGNREHRDFNTVQLLFFLFYYCFSSIGDRFPMRVSTAARKVEQRPLKSARRDASSCSFIYVAQVAWWAARVFRARFREGRDDARR